MTNTTACSVVTIVEQLELIDSMSEPVVRDSRGFSAYG